MTYLLELKSLQGDDMQASPGKAHIAVTHNKSLACDVNTLIDAYTPPIPPHSGEGGGGGKSLTIGTDTHINRYRRGRLCRPLPQLWSGKATDAEVYSSCSTLLRVNCEIELIINVDELNLHTKHTCVSLHRTR